MSDITVQNGTVYVDRNEPIFYQISEYEKDSHGHTKTVYVVYVIFQEETINTKEFEHLYDAIEYCVLGESNA